MVVDTLMVPDEIAAAVLRPESYSDFENQCLPAAAWLRENMPVGRSSLPDYDPIWIVSRYADISEVLRDANRFHSGDFNPMVETRASDEYTRSINNGSTRIWDLPTYMDPPEHTKYRRVLAEKFEPAVVRDDFETRFRTIASELVGQLLQGDGECDFVTDFVINYPLRVVMSILGVPKEDHARMLELAKEFFGTTDPSTMRDEFKDFEDGPARQFAAASNEFAAFFQNLREQRAIEYEEDLTSFFNEIKTRDGAPWPDGVKNSFLAGIALGGIDTTVLSLTGGLLGLIRYPDQWALLKRNPDDEQLLKGLVDEAIRWTAPGRVFGRNATEATQVGGVEIEAMDRLAVLLYSGNRDPEAFPDADRFDITRNATRHLSFSHGPHRCLGQHIATVEMKILYEELLPHIESVELTGEPVWEAATLVSGIRSLPVKFTMAQDPRRPCSRR